MPQSSRQPQADYGLVTAIIGGGRGCAAILRMIEEDLLGRFPMRVMGVADLDPEAPGMRYARSLGIETVTTDFRELYRIPDLDLVIELTGNDEVRTEVERSRPRTVRLIDHFGARLFWQLHQAEEAIIAQRTELQRRVEEERARIEAILDSIPDEITVLDRDMVIQHANASYLRNNDLDIAHVRGLNCYDAEQKVRGECQVAMDDCPARAALYDGRVSSVLRKHYDEHGNSRYAVLLGAPVVGRDGEVTGMIEMVRDVTDSMALEEALAAKEVRLHQFMEMSPLAIYLKDRQGRYLEANPAACELFGRAKREVLGRTDREIFPKDAADVLRQGDQEVLREQQQLTVDGELLINGEPRFLKSIKYPLLDARGEVLAVGGITSDITQRRTVQNELTTTREYLQSILDNAPVMVVTADAEGRIKAFNRRAQAVLGYSPEEVVGEPVTMLYRRHEDRMPLLRRISQGEVVQDYETVLTAKDGSEVPTSINLAGLADPTGRNIGTVGMSLDVSGRKALMNKIVQSERLAAVGRLAAGVAHEINNPMAVISEMAGFLEDIVTGIAPSEPETLEKYLKKFLPRIVAQVRRCRSITSRLLSFSRKDEQKLERTNPNRALDEVLPLLEKQALLANSVIHRDYPADLPRVRIDEVQFEEVLINLVTNAIHALGEHHGGNIWVSAELTESMVVFSVRDDGPGIAEDVSDRLFDPFVTTKPVGQGTGLGLSICFGIVKRYDGEIRVESQLGKGARFDVALQRLAEPD